MPTYNNNIPQPGDFPSQSQSQILQNFQQLDTAWAVNHVDFNTADQGKHAKVTFPIQSPAPAFLVGEIGLFNQNAYPTSVPDLWLTRGTGSAFPMTGYSIDVSGQSGWTYYPSGVLYAWGQVQVVAATPITITYISADTSGGAGVNFPGFTIMGNPQITFVGTSLSTTRISGYTNLEFTVVSLSSGTILWHAIGI